MEAVEFNSPVVSIQNPDLGDAVAGHLAWGDLLTPQVVAVGSVDWAYGNHPRFDVLLASPTDDGGGYVERIRPRRIEIVTKRDGGKERGAVVWLAQESNHPPAHPGAPAGRAEELFATRLTTGARRAALRRTADQAGMADVEAVLGPVARWELEHRADLVSEVDEPASPNARMWWCFLFGGCRGPRSWW